MMGTLGRIVQQGLLGARNIIQEHLEGPVREIYKVPNMSDMCRQGAEYVECIHNCAEMKSEDELFSQKTRISCMLWYMCLLAR